MTSINENITLETAFLDSVELLKRLIAIPSISRDETECADFIADFLKARAIPFSRHGNNLWATHIADPARPTLLLNAHIDTVRPVKGWKRDPFTPTLEGDTLFGLGSNDCGGGLVGLLAAFRLLRKDKSLPWNLVWLASCEEEVSGKGGIESVIPMLPKIDCAIVGEPTGMQPAVAEKGLMVLDLVARGKSGHAARNEGVNAIYKSLDDIAWFKDYRFPKVSPLLGPVKMTVTMISAGTQHNVVPDECRMVVDVRPNEMYSNVEILDEIVKNVSCEVKARSTRLNSSSIPEGHPLVKACVGLGLEPYGSPTLSDQALMHWPSLKLGPGESSRSHTADEYVKLSEIRDGIERYCDVIKLSGKML